MPCSTCSFCLRGVGALYWHCKHITYDIRLLAGLAFLLLFFAWGLSYIRGHTRSAAVRVGGTIWGALAGGAAALLLGQIILQSIYAAGKAGWATDPDTRRLLQLLGLTKAKNAKQIILVRLPDNIIQCH